VGGLISLLLSALLVGEAAADASLSSACQLDFQLFCAEIDPESARSAVEACLRKYQPSLTEECRAVLDPASVPKPVGAGGSGSVCQADFQRLCAHATDRMSAARCVERHLDELSPGCRDALGVAPPKRRGPGSP
jgi:hypothetical protein